MKNDIETNNLSEFFLQEKPSHLLLKIKRRNKENYASVLSREIGCTYSHTVKVLSEFNDMNLIEFNQDGRKKLIELTKKGEQIADRMEGLVKEMNGKD